MGMFLNFFFFELKLRAKGALAYSFFAVFFFLAFFGVAAEDFMIGPGKVLLNGPYETAQIQMLFSFFGMILVAGIFGPAILRDFQLNTYQLIFTKPLSKFAYLGGRWLGSFVTTVFVFSGLIFGELAGSLAPWVDHTRLLPVDGHLVAMILKTFIQIPLIQAFFLGASFFCVAALTRKLVIVYLQGIGLFVVYLGFLFSVLTARSLNRFWPSVFDPLGNVLIDSVTRYWTVADRNGMMIPWHGEFLYNRLLWIGVGCVALLVAYIFFPMQGEAVTVRSGKKRNLEADEELGPPRPTFHVVLPRVTQIFGLATTWAQFISMMRVRMKNIFSEVLFWAICLMMVGLNLLTGRVAGRINGANVYPVTYLMLQAVENWSILLLYIIVTIYAGELIWRERDTKFELIHDALPFAGWVDWMSKFAAICIVQLAILTVVLLTGVLSQAMQGYFRFELGQYFKELYLITFVMICTFALFCMAIQTFVKNKFVGHAIAIAVFFIPTFITRWGWIDVLYLFNNPVSYTYSDMNGYGHFVKPLFWEDFYWLAFACLLAVFAIALAQRGTEAPFGERWRNAKLRLPSMLPIAALFALAFLGSGAWIYYNTHVLNEIRTDQEQRHRQADYEKLYKKYERLPQPKITDVDTRVNLLPETRSFEATGTFTLKNKTDQPIPDIHINATKESVDEVTFDRPSHITLSDPKHWYTIYHLETPLAPGEEMKMFFKASYHSHGFRNNGERPELVANGTFFDQDYFPHLGYNRGQELDNPVRRKEEKLGPLEELAPRGDPYYTNVNLFTPDGDWITYHTIVSTAPDQIALSPGYLQKQWKQNGRNYFEYSMGQTKMLEFYDYNSGRYDVKRAVYQGVNGPINIEVYHDPKHEFDNDDMIEASKKGLEYYEKNYGPFQFGQYRILEYPRYRTFAQSFPNTIPFSEGIGFIGKVEKPDDIDFTYFVTDHELAHQWWAHQLIGGAVLGSNMMSESFAEYSALRVMEKKYGAANMRKFLRYELDGYLRGRAGEVRHEPPLVLVQNEPYVWYQKGSLVLYGLSDYIGEDKVNLALKTLLDKYKFAGPPYPDTRALTAELRAVTPPELQYLITDMFETITLYDNKTTTATYVETPDHTFKVTMHVDAKKLKADGTGNETVAPLNDLIELGVFKGEKNHEVPLHVEKRWINQPTSTFEFIVDEKPTRAGIDPFNKLIDRNPEDNTVDITKQ
ncbi:Peptidase family M1 [Granulicella pectinivorans]|uniref:Peptidase family M1 n=1 Tax=Granulicella pectinivorans TaxID=474950 RepID=A0A1I6LWY4_9BACT|nr:M1 family aminopeptidase [Granulicella pectinivorans]SFS07920.1 Peptidase family M1 [Granulicella pectinivorans]